MCRGVSFQFVSYLLIFKLMKKFLRFSVLSLLLLMGNMVYAQEEKVVTLDFTSNEGWNFPTEAKKITAATYTKDGLTVTFSTGSAKEIQWTNGQLKVAGLIFLILPKFDFEVEKIDYETGSEQTALAVSLGSGEKNIMSKTVGKNKVYTFDLTSDEKYKSYQAPNTEYKFLARTKFLGVKSIKVYGKTTTGIHEVKADHANSDVYYTLSGVRVAHPQKGIYIVNGKKVVLK